MFPIPFNFPFIKKNGERTTIGDAISAGGGSYTLPTASANTKGGVKIGSGLTMDGEVLNNSNPTPYSLPIASDEVLGGVKIGSGLSIVNGVLSATGGGGGSATHCFYLNTSNNHYKTLLVFTDASTITDLASLEAAVKEHGVAFVLTDGDNSNARYRLIRQSGSYPKATIETLTISNSEIRYSYEDATITWQGSLSNITKLF